MTSASRAAAGTIASGENPLNPSMYLSVIAFGTIRVVEAAEEKTRFCVELMRKYADPTWRRPQDFFPRLGDITVYAIALDRLTGKEQALPEVSRRWPALDSTKTPDATPTTSPP